MRRLRDWRSRLNDVIEARRREPFSEINNCAMFLADCVFAMTGTDLAAPYRGRFSTLAEAIVLLRRDGYEDLPAFLAKHFEEVHPAFSRAGDIAVLPGGDGTGWAGGIVNGERVTVMTETALATIDRIYIVRAFRV